MFKRFIKKDEGQDLIEYALLAALIAVALVTAMGLVAGGIEGVFDRVIAALDAA
jgi:pilus assembly protein Flp/PilA